MSTLSYILRKDLMYDKLYSMRKGLTRPPRRSVEHYRQAKILRGYLVDSAGRRGNYVNVQFGYSPRQLTEHIEAQWRPGMSWSNYGRGGWVIDHIRPLSSFDLTTPEQIVQCFALDNLQPLWERENRAKWYAMCDNA